MKLLTFFKPSYLRLFNRYGHQHFELGKVIEEECKKSCIGRRWRVLYDQWSKCCARSKLHFSETYPALARSDCKKQGLYCLVKHCPCHLDQICYTNSSHMGLGIKRYDARPHALPGLAWQTHCFFLRRAAAAANQAISQTSA